MGRCSYTWEELDKENREHVKRCCQKETWEGSDEFCIFHDPSPEKDVDLFKRYLEEQIQAETENHNFIGYYFPANWDFFTEKEFRIGTDFREATFQGPIYFGGATFHDFVYFGGATFHDFVYFGGATFHDFVYFGGATFLSANFEVATFKDAYFRGATFKNTNFEGATFQSANFRGATFKNTNFEGATFQSANFTRATFRNTNFDGATFKEYTSFKGTTFLNDSYFLRTTFNEADFSGATFEKACFEGATFKDVSFSGATFKNANFSDTAFQGLADFSRATFVEAATFKRATFQDVDFRQGIFRANADFSGASFNKKLEMAPENIRELDFRYAEFLFQSHVTVDLEKVLFYKAFIENVAFHGYSWDRTTTLYEERHMGDRDINLSYSQLETIYRDLKLNMQNHGDHSTAGELHYREMEMRRKGTSKREGLWLNLYKAIAGYGERPQNTALASASIVFLFAFLYATLDCLHYSVENPSLQQKIIDVIYFSFVTFTTLGLGDIAPVNNWGKALICAEAVIGAFMIAVFVVVFVRKMAR